MQLPDGVQITNVTESPKIGPGTQVTKQTNYYFTVQSLGPFTVQLSGADDTPANVRSAIEARVASLRAVGAIQ
jgi:hypothetical protein